MFQSKLSRRTFLKASATSAAAVTAVGAVSFNEWSEKNILAKENVEIKKITSTCDSCSSKCGIIVQTKNGRLHSLEGQPDHPNSKGKLCARGHGYSTIAYSPDRVKEPMKRNSKGEFEPISWEQAFEEIGTKLKEIVSKYGPQSVSITEDPRPSSKFYSPRFINALGSANYFPHLVVCSSARDTGYFHTLGVNSTGPDLGNTRFIMFIGRSYADGIRPSSIMGLAAAKKNGTKVVIVDPRLNNTANFANEWLAIRPGTDLAFVLAMSHVLVKEELYDKDFIANYTLGFEEYAKGLIEYTPEWAEGITGIPADTIARLAREMAGLKPKALIESSWRGAFGCTYFNSTETGRAIAQFNALLGNYQKPGGNVFGTKPHLGELDPAKYPAPPKPTVKKLGVEEYPLVFPPNGVATIVEKKAMEGISKAVIFNHSNAALGYGNPKYMAEALSKMELVVTIEIMMTDTALNSHYVLPDTTYLERDEVIEELPGKVPGIALRQKALDKVVPNSKPIDEIYQGLAEAAGIGQYFNFTVEEVNKALLAPTGISLDTLKEKGTIMFPDQAVKMGELPKLKTPSGKVEFYSKAYEEAGFNPVVQWQEPKVMPDKDSFRLITGKQSIHTHTQTANVPMLMQITKDYDLERVWMNPKRAKELGIKDGDMVEIKSSEATSKVRVFVTERIHPEAIFVPSHYGIRSKYQKTAKDIGFGYMEHVPFDLEPIGGHAMIHEVIVTVRKVGE